MRTMMIAAATLAAGLATAATADPGVTPALTELTATPGNTFTIDKTVSTPAIAPLADVFFLADTTGSMSAPIDNVRTNAGAILATIASGATDPRFGAGDYKDFQSPQADPYVFNPAAPLGSAAAAQAAIAGWAANGGWDGPEGQLYALHRLATDPAIGWRPGSSRFLVWFGDSPGHDPICSAMWGGGFPLTTGLVASELAASKIKVIAVSTNTGYPNGLNDDVMLWGSDYDYNAVCGAPVPSSNQANLIAAATGGSHSVAGSPGDLASRILSGLQKLPATVTHEASCGPGLSVSLSPDSQSGTSGDTFAFTETVSVSPGAVSGTYTCEVRFLVNGVASPEFTEHVTVTIGAGGVSAGGPYVVDEGGTAMLHAVASGWGTPVTLAWDLDGDGTFETAGSDVALVGAEGPATQTVRVKATDGAYSVVDETTVTVANVAPVVVVASPSDGALVSNTESVSLIANFTDAGTLDTHACSIDWETSVGPGAVSETAGSGDCLGAYTFASPGVYTVKVTVKDDDGAVGTATTTVVVYDPTAGFVTGGGTIYSPPGALLADPTVHGAANFGFISRYAKGATVPSGQTEFRFATGRFNFHSSAYQWLVVAGNRAQYKGTGTVNGVDGYGFMLTAVDGALTAGGGDDQFRIKVWELSSGAVVYDNVAGASDDGPPQTIASGSIVIHKTK